MALKLFIDNLEEGISPKIKQSKTKTRIIGRCAIPLVKILKYGTNINRRENEIKSMCFDLNLHKDQNIKFIPTNSFLVNT